MTEGNMDIREGIERILDELLFSDAEDGAFRLSECINNLLAYLHSQGVVKKVDRELPNAPIPCPEPIPNDIYFYRGYERCKSDMAGYEAVEPLIKEE